MSRFLHVIPTLLLLAPPLLGGSVPLVGVECELASRLRGPARLHRDSGASQGQCLELVGERAAALLKVRAPATGRYTVWARARAVGGEPVAVSARDDGQRLNAAVPDDAWQWVNLGTMALARGTRELHLTATGALRLDQLALAGSADYTPEGALDTAGASEASLREIYFSDDFMRTAREAGVWQTASGKWAVTELRKRERFDATRSANAFSFLGQGTEAAPALAVTGYPSWRNYSIESAVRSLGGQAFGLVILRQDDANYYLLRCDPRAGVIELLRCLDGVTDRLDACQGQLRTDDWFLFRLEACHGELSASIDGHPLLRATDHTFLEGLPGLWCADPTGAYFDDVLVRSLDLRVERFESPALDGWDAAGDWAPTRGGVRGAGTLLQRDAWGDFELETTLHPSNGEAGLLFDWRGEGHYAAAVFAAGKLEVREVRDGRATTLASAPLPRNGGPRPHRILLTQQRGRVSIALDGAAALSTLRPQAGAGRVGLFAGAPARFGAVRLARAQRAVPVRVHNRIFAGEDTMEAWASAASDWQLAAPAAARTLAWHEIEHWGDCTVRCDLGQPPSLPGKLGLVVRADGQQPETGYQLVVEPQAGGPHKLTLLRAAQPVGQGTAPAGARAIELRWIADCAAAFADDALVLWHRDPAPLPGRRAALWAEGWRPALEQCAVHSERVLDDYFETAPVAWRVASGTWEMQNRWTCSPQWSWMGGSSPDAAVLWNKQRFRGDLTVHFFAAFQMIKRDSRIYRPGDLNVSLCADGQNPASGYSFIYGGWNNTATALLRRGQIVASTTKLALRPPTLLDSTPETNSLHRKWWHIAIEKHGPTIACFVDDALVLEYTDPEPLDAGSVCLWTHDNSVMIARTWIAYQDTLGAEDPLRPRIAAPIPALPPPPEIAAAHKALLHDFEDGAARWAGTPGSSATRLEARDDGYALAVTNPRSGGPFELKMPLGPFDAMAYARLTFDYRFPPEAKVNLHLKMNGRRHAVLLTNPEARPAGVPILGAAPLQADDAWHTADVDLRALLLRCYPAAAALPVDEVALSTLDKANYLTAGIGGNPAGVTYRLDNVRLWAPGPPDVRFTWAPETEASVVLDRSPATLPADDKTLKGGVFEQTGLADGLWFFHLRARAADGGWSRVAHLPILVDTAAPTVVASNPAPGARSSASVVGIDLADESGIDPKTLRLTLFDQDQPVQIVPSDPAASFTPGPATYDPVAKHVALDLSRLPLAFEDGQEIKLTLAAADFAGHAMAPYALTWHYDRSGDKEPPRLTRLDASHPCLCDDDFETGLGQWAATPEYSLIERDASTAASGRYSLRIYNLHAAGPFTVTIRSTPFDAGRYPLVSFDYKVPPGLRADFVLTIAGVPYTIRFTDPNGTNCIGAVPEVQADGQWHHTEFNLHEILTTALPQAASYTITALQLADTGFLGNADGVEYHLDNFRIAPAASTKAGPLEWKLAAADPSGIAAFQHSLTALPGAPKWVESPEPAWQFRDLGAGLFQFAVRARDRAGNWSEPLQRTVLVDDQPPAIQNVEPQPGARSADGRIRVQLADKPSGIHREKTTLTVAGTAYRLTDPGVTYDARTGTLTWDAAFLAKPITIADGQDVPVALHTEDNVGNAADRAWTWKMDYSLDKTPPPELYVASIPSNCLVRNTFEDDAGSFAAYGGYGELERVTTTAATGRYSLCTMPTREGRYFSFYAYKAAFDAAKHPILSFDYRIPPGLAINLHLHNASGWHAIKLTSPSTYYPVVGEVPIISDDKWHHAEIDILQFLKPATPGASCPIRYVLFADFGGHTARPGLRMYLDNFTIAERESGQNLRFEWNAAADATGIAGYAYALDQAPATQPANLAGPAATAAFQGLKPGNWFFHLRACDGAGNWGPVTHFPVVVPAPPPPAPPAPSTPPPKQ
ncbi:MAG TPA: hypothetical protein PLE19_18690 [Planctomycetota bacterium]|nr:hypothetical protein [Planctomycetota bacterium]HRR81809.1 hypothetical protein [Planctomycetota bacterium]